MIPVQVGRIIEIGNDSRHLSIHRGFMVVQDRQAHRDVAHVAIDDVAAVIGNAHGLSYSNNLLEALAARSIPFVLCGPNHNVVAMLIPVEGHWAQAKRFDAQVNARVPLRKRLWAELVRAKIRNQASVLDAIGLPSAPLGALLKRVRSGDGSNVEAQASRRYWTLLFGADFRRDRKAGGCNGMLNYGYTVLRAATARAVVAAGLHPTVGIHHSNEGNAMRLVDDLVEPFRPLIDETVWRLLQDGAEEVNVDVKRRLACVPYVDRSTIQGSTPLIACINRLAASLAEVFLGERRTLDLPRPESLGT